MPSSMAVPAPRCIVSETFVFACLMGCVLFLFLPSVPAQRREPVPAAHAAPVSSAYQSLGQKASVLAHWERILQSTTAAYMGLASRVHSQHHLCWQAFRCQCVVCSVGTRVNRVLTDFPILLLRRAFTFMVHLESC